MGKFIKQMRDFKSAFKSNLQPILYYDHFRHEWKNSYFFSEKMLENYPYFEIIIKNHK